MTPQEITDTINKSDIDLYAINEHLAKNEIEEALLYIQKNFQCDDKTAAHVLILYKGQNYYNYGHTAESSNLNKKNAIGGVLQILAILVLIFGTIGSITVADSGGRYHTFEFSTFIIYEFATILSAFILMGFAEIIILLHKIAVKSK